MNQPTQGLAGDEQFVDQVIVAMTKDMKVFVITPHGPDSKGVYDEEKVANSVSLLLNGIPILFKLPKAPKDQLSKIESPRTPLIIKP